jgi:hypothetical protein
MRLVLNFPLFSGWQKKYIAHCSLFSGVGVGAFAIFASLLL